MSNAPTNAEHDKTLSNRMRGFGAIILKRWWLVIIGIGVTVSAAFVLLKYQVPYYRATSKLVVGMQPPRVMAGIQEVAEIMDGSPWRYREYMVTQLDIIRSYGVAAEVLDRLDLWDAEVIFGKASPLDAQLPAAELRLKRASYLASRIQAKDTPDSMIVEVSFEAPDPKIAAKIATTVAEVYRDQNLDLKKKVVQSAGDDLKEVEGKRREEKLAAEKAIEDFEKQVNVGTVPTRKKEVETTLNTYNRKLRDAIARKNILEAELEQIHKLKKKGGLGVAATQVLQNHVISELKLTYVRQQTAVSSLEEEYGPKHPKLISAKKQLGHISGALNSEVSAVLKSIESGFEKAKAEEDRFQVLVVDAERKEEQIAAISSQYDKLKKQYDSANELYERVRKRHEETTLTRELATNNIRVLNDALVPKAPVRPNRPLTIVLASFLGVLLGIGLALLMETADTSIRDKEHAERVSGLSVLGLIPAISTTAAAQQLGGEKKKSRDLYIHYFPHSEAAEMGRTLRTNLMFLSAERRLRTLMVTSPLPQDGKTTVASQICTTLAHAGQRVVIVEADMRRPRLAETFSVETDRGLSTYLSDPRATIDDVIQPSEVPGLDTIVCGPTPPNPAELLNSARLDQIIRELHERYDVVLFDTPPVNAVADAAIMTSRVDGVVLVAKCERTTSEALRHAMASLKSVGAPMLGMVLNDIRSSHFGYYRKKYYTKGYHYYRSQPAEVPTLELIKDREQA